MFWMLAALVACFPDFDEDRAITFVDNPTHDYDADGFTEEEGDCDDGDNTLYPSLWYPDADGDGFGDALTEGYESCGAPPGFLENNLDCDDSNEHVYPDAIERCNGVFENCTHPMKGIQEVPPAEADEDGDGYVECQYDDAIWEGESSVIGGGDCNDADATTYPGGAPNTSTTACLRDADGDGFSESRWDTCVAADFMGGSQYQLIPEFSEESEYESDFGLVVATGDVDDDGLDDILVGIPYHSNEEENAGKAYLFLGKSLGISATMNFEDADYIFSGSAAWDFLGSAVSLGDVDGDGQDDILIGSPLQDDGGEDAGASYLIFASSLGDESDFNIENADTVLLGQVGEWSGWSASIAGDVNGDGQDDVLIGAPYGGDIENSGISYLILGNHLGNASSFFLADSDYYFSGMHEGDESGSLVSMSGDVDGDGLDDIFIGAPGSDIGGADSGVGYLVWARSLSTESFLSLGSSDYVFSGENAGDFVGSSVSMSSDIDGDGLADLLIGAYGSDVGGADAGMAYLILGHRLSDSPASFDLRESDYSLIGENPNDNLGWSLSSAGDVDFDGLDDILIGAPGRDAGGIDVGHVYLMTGDRFLCDSVVAPSDAEYVFVGREGSLIGQAISSGDFDGDGQPNFIMHGLNGASIFSPCASWETCSLSQRISNASQRFTFGGHCDNCDPMRHSIASGDFDGDGLEDILIGNYSLDGFRGEAFLVMGNRLADESSFGLSNVDYVFVGENEGNAAGWPVHAADVDGDGLDDILIGAHAHGDVGAFAGKVYLILGSRLGDAKTISLSNADYVFIGEESGDAAGISISSGDVDGDGLDDILISAHGSNDGGNAAGKVHLILGSHLGDETSISLADANYHFIGENEGDFAGWPVLTGDVDGDGLDDIFVGAFHNDDGGEDAGKVYILLGSRLGDTPSRSLGNADYSFIGEYPMDVAGRSISVGNIDGDCLADILIGAPGNDDAGEGAGKVYLIRGSHLGGSSSTSLSNADYFFLGEGINEYDSAGIALSAGDVDGDGLDDILVGASENNAGGEDAGKAYLILSKGLEEGQALSLANADYTFRGESPSDYFGRSMSLVHGIDGSNRSRVIVGHVSGVALFESCEY